jgi:hypothetical protein
MVGGVYNRPLWSQTPAVCSNRFGLVSAFIVIRCRISDCCLSNQSYCIVQHLEQNMSVFVCKMLQSKNTTRPKTRKYMETEIRRTEERLTARRLQLYQTTHSTRKRQASMLQALFETAIPANEFYNHVDGHWVRLMLFVLKIFLSICG